MYERAKFIEGQFLIFFNISGKVMSTITNSDYERIKEPCKSCYLGLEAHGRGKSKAIYCKAKHAKLMGEGKPYWFEIIDCPMHDRAGNAR